MPTAEHTPEQAFEPRPATGVEIREILGPVEDDIVMEILKTGASAHDVMQAYAWVCDDDYMETYLHEHMTDTIQKVYDILESDQDSDEEQSRLVGPL